MIRMMCVWVHHGTIGDPANRLETSERLVNPAHIRYLEPRTIWDPGIDDHRDVVRIHWAQSNANTTDTLATLPEWEALLKEARL